LQSAQHWSAAQAHLIFCQVSIHPRQALLAQKARGHSSINNARLRLANELKHTIIQHKETQKNILEKKMHLGSLSPKFYGNDEYGYRVVLEKSAIQFVIATCEKLAMSQQQLLKFSSPEASRRLIDTYGIFCNRVLTFSFLKLHYDCISF
jgi:hypothetical protein